MLNGGRKPTVLDQTADARIRLTRRFVIRVGCKVVVVAMVDFLLLRVWGPDLVNLHQDLALLGGVACLVIALSAALWLAFQLWEDVKTFNQSKRDIPRTRPFEVETK